MLLREPAHAFVCDGELLEIKGVLTCRASGQVAPGEPGQHSLSINEAQTVDIEVERVSRGCNVDVVLILSGERLLEPIEVPIRRCSEPNDPGDAW